MNLILLSLHRFVFDSSTNCSGTKGFTPTLTPLLDSSKYSAKSFKKVVRIPMFDLLWSRMTPSLR